MRPNASKLTEDGGRVTSSPSPAPGTSGTSRTARATSTSRSTAPEEATESALRRMISTFFDGSAARAVAAVLDAADRELSDEELDEIARLIEDARRRGR